MEPILIYCYDPYCAWCYGFSKVIKRISFQFKNRLNIEVLSGGMILPRKPVHISATAEHMQSLYKNVGFLTGAHFGEDYLWHLNNPEKSDWYPDSEKAAIALCILKEYLPEKQVTLAIDLQYALHGEGRDLCDDETYRHLLRQYMISKQDFYGKLHSNEYREKAHAEFELVKKLKVAGYPCVLLQLTTSTFYFVAEGYTDFPAMRNNINAILDKTG